MPESVIGGENPTSFVVKRHFSLTSRHFLVVVSIGASLSLVFAVAFSLIGAWTVLPFSFLEVAALILAFVWHIRHAADFERIIFVGGWLVVEVREGFALHRVEMPAPWVRILFDSLEERLYLVAPGNRIEVGRFVGRSERQRLACEMRQRFQ